MENINLTPCESWKAEQLRTAGWDPAFLGDDEEGEPQLDRIKAEAEG